MAKKSIVRIHGFQAGTPIRSSEVNNELNQLVTSVNELYDCGEYENNLFYPLASRVIEPTWNPRDLKSFLEVAHYPDGRIKSDGIADAELYNHNHDPNAHPEVQTALTDYTDTQIQNHTNDPNSHPDIRNDIQALNDRVTEITNSLTIKAVPFVRGSYQFFGADYSGTALISKAYNPSAGTYHLLRTTDGGNTWTEVFTGIEASNVLRCLGYGVWACWSGNDARFAISTDDGVTWTAYDVATLALTIEGINYTKINYVKDIRCDGTNLYFGAEADTGAPQRDAIGAYAPLTDPTLWTGEFTAGTADPNQLLSYAQRTKNALLYKDGYNVYKLLKYDSNNNASVVITIDTTQVVPYFTYNDVVEDFTNDRWIVFDSNTWIASMDINGNIVDKYYKSFQSHPAVASRSPLMIATSWYDQYVYTHYLHTIETNNVKGVRVTTGRGGGISQVANNKFYFSDGYIIEEILIK